MVSCDKVPQFRSIETTWTYWIVKEPHTSCVTNQRYLTIERKLKTSLLLTIVFNVVSGLVQYNLILYTICGIILVTNTAPLNLNQWLNAITQIHIISIVVLSFLPWIISDTVNIIRRWKWIVVYKSKWWATVIRKVLHWLVRLTTIYWFLQNCHPRGWSTISHKNKDKLVSGNKNSYQ